MFSKPLMVALGLLAILFTFGAQAQPTLVSVVPADGTIGVSTTATVVFTFDAAVDTNTVVVEFSYFNLTTFEQIAIPVTSSWNAGFTVLSCKAVTSFPPNSPVLWTLDTPDISESGGFVTSSGGGGGTGSGTNQYTSFSVGKLHYYHQTNDVVTLDNEVPYFFLANTGLASNRTATAISLTLPTGATRNLANQPFGPQEDYQYYDYQTNLATFDATYPAGNYVFNITSTPASTPVTANLPTAMQQPNAPKISNWTALQSANPTQPVTISWNAFQGGTAADYISVQVGNVFLTPDFGATNALNGTQTSVTIPAGKLQTNTNYEASVSFYHGSGVTNQAKAEVTQVFRSTSTDFIIHTTTGGGGTGEPAQFSGSAIVDGKFSCEITCAPGQTITIESSSTMEPGSWVNLLTTTATGNKVQFTDSRPLGDRAYYRVRNGS